MNYLNLILQQKQDKLAIIVDEEWYTYGSLTRKVIAVREQINKKQPYIFIHESKIIDQLIQFLAYSGTNCLPIIATEASKKQDFEIDNIPSKACMGVMTSGSTGKSKLLWRSYHSWADFFPVQNKVFGINSDTIIFCQGSLAFTGNLNIYMSILAVGGTIVATEKFRPKYWLELIDKYVVNTLYLIPTKLLLLPKFAMKQNLNMKQIVTGSQSMGKQEALKLKRIYPQAEIVLYYGASELNYITYIRDCEMTDDRTLIGKPFDNVKIMVRNGEIFVNTVYGVEGISLPFSLKDKGYIDENNNLHFKGRKDDICNVNGLKISLSKVEDALLKVLCIDEAVALVKHENDMDILKAFVVAEKQQSKQVILKSLKKYLADFEIPKQIIYLKSLPKNESGKIDKFKLKQFM